MLDPEQLSDVLPTESKSVSSLSSSALYAQTNIELVLVQAPVTENSQKTDDSDLNNLPLSHQIGILSQAQKHPQQPWGKKQKQTRHYQNQTGNKT